MRLGLCTFLLEGSRPQVNKRISMFFFKRKDWKEVKRDSASIYCDPVSTNARTIFEEAGMCLVETPDEADLLWMRKGYRPWFGHLRPGQMLNHLPNEQAMTDKGLLAEHLKDYESNRTGDGLALKDFYRETYCLYDEADRNAFLKQLPAEDSQENLWILKPSGSSRGRGIRIAWDFTNMRKNDAQNPKGEEENLITDRYIIQRYIKNPLLLNGRKSEIRVYWLIASIDPLKVLLFDEGTVRLNSQPFKLEDFDNTLVHVTNVYQQKIHPDYDPSLVLKWSFAEWEKYLVEELKLTQPGFVGKTLMPRIKECLAFVVRSVLHSLRVKFDQGIHFGLYGADIILDDQLRPWLTEIQKGPGISFGDPIKRVLIPAVMRETVSIMNEVRWRQLHNETWEELNSRQRFQWVVR